MPPCHLVALGAAATCSAGCRRQSFKIGLELFIDGPLDALPGHATDDIPNTVRRAVALDYADPACRRRAAAEQAARARRCSWPPPGRLATRNRHRPQSRHDAGRAALKPAHGGVGPPCCAVGGGLHCHAGHPAARLIKSAWPIGGGASSWSARSARRHPGRNAGSLRPDGGATRRRSSGAAKVAVIRRWFSLENAVPGFEVQQLGIALKLSRYSAQYLIRLLRRNIFLSVR